MPYYIISIMHVIKLFHNLGKKKNVGINFPTLVYILFVYMDLQVHTFLEFLISNIYMCKTHFSRQKKKKKYKKNL